MQVFSNSTLIAEGETSFFRVDTHGKHGFRVNLPGLAVTKAVAHREITVFAVAADETLVDIPLHPHIVSKASLLLARKLVMELDQEQVTELAATLSNLSAAPVAVRGGNQTSDRNKSEPIVFRHDDTRHLGLSYLGVLPGHVTADKSVIVGNNGYLFILEGSNNLIAQYAAQPDSPALGKMANDWAKVVDTRRLEFGKRHISFVQIIIPEKSSVVGEYFPIPKPPETPLLARLEQELSETTSRKIYFSSLARMRTDSNRASIFRRLDSHLSPYGARSTFCGLLESLDAPTGRKIAFNLSRLQTADLGSKFDNLPLRESVQHPEPAQFYELELGLKQIAFESPQNGQHIGIRCVWTNSAAPLALRVVAFGNSFFERGASAANLSWWASRWFREFHFIWSPLVDYAYIERIAPDVVVCQTIERFLPIVPRA